MTKRRLKLFIIVGAVLLGSLVPFPTTIVPEWRLQFIDQDDNPIPGMQVTAVCQHYTYTDDDYCASDARQTSGPDGYVSFPAKQVWLSLGGRAIRALPRYALVLVHGSVGISAYLLVIRPVGFDGPQTVDYKPGQPPPGKVVYVRRNGETAYQ